MNRKFDDLKESARKSPQIRKWSGSVGWVGWVAGGGMSRKAMYYVRLFFAPPAVLDNCDEHDDATREEEEERRERG